MRLFQKIGQPGGARLAEKKNLRSSASSCKEKTAMWIDRPDRGSAAAMSTSLGFACSVCLLREPEEDLELMILIVL